MSDVLIVNIIVAGLPASTTVRPMVAHRRVLPYYLISEVCRQYCPTLPLLSFRLPPGTSISVYGTLGVNPTTSQYVIDGSSPSTYIGGKVALPVYQQMFFKSPALADAEHTLLITNAGAGELWIDYLLYTPPQPVLSLSSSSSRPSTTPSSRPTLTSLAPSRTPVTNTPTSTSSENTSNTVLPGEADSKTKSSISKPVAVGCAIGALVLIMILIYGLLYYRKRAKQLAGKQLLERKGIFGEMTTQFLPYLTPGLMCLVGSATELNKTDPVAPGDPFAGVYVIDPYASSSYGGPNTNMYPNSAHPPVDNGYQNQSHPSTPIYHFSNPYPRGSVYGAPPDGTVGAGTVSRNDRVDNGTLQNRGSQYGYAVTVGQSDYRNSRSRYSGGPYASPDWLPSPEHRDSPRDADLDASLAYLSGDVVGIDLSSPLPDVSPSPSATQNTPQRSEKSGFIVHNPEIYQHEDGGVRLDAQPHSSGSQQQQAVDIPPVYKPNY